jgi:membrane protein DedA with SNARE-associated domain
LGSFEQFVLHVVNNWYATTGYLGIVFAMALESCCIPLPSEIVMPLAGLYVAQHPERFSLWGVGIAGAIGCVIGSVIAYGIGAAGGRPLLLRYGRYILVSRRDSERADRWFARYGAPTAFFSRLVPIVRTYISLPAGIARMNFGQFVLYTFLGSLPWTFVLAYLGYRLGAQFLRLTTVFRGLDIAVIVVFVALVALYIYRHIRAASHDKREDVQPPPAPPAPSLPPTSVTNQD